VLKVAEGQPCYQVGEQGLLRHRNKDTVAAWVKAYRTEGLAALQQQPRGHRGYSPRTGRATPTGR
jgi:transposase